MQIIPAIDIFQNSCVRLTGGIFTDRTDYGLAPADVAAGFLRDGAGYLHVVDLEGAKEGKVVNWAAIEAVAGVTGSKMEVGGGIRSDEEVERLLGFGVDKIVVGSVALQDPELLGRWISKFGPERICIALDIKDGGIAYAGWQEVGKKTIGEVASYLIAEGITTFLSTDITRDGRLSGPNITLYSLLVRTFPAVRWLASGGVRSKDDVAALRKTGVAGAIIGKALYEGHLRLTELLGESC